MLTASFPIYSEQEYLDRKLLLAKEYHIYADDNMPIREFMYLSDAAIKSRKDRIEAVKKNKMCIDQFTRTQLLL